MAVDPDGRVRYANSKANTVLDEQDVDLVGRDWVKTFFPAAARSAAREEFERTLDEGAVAEYELPVSTSDGTGRRVLWRTTPLQDDDGTVIGTLNSAVEVEDGQSSTSTTDADLQQYRTLIEQFPNGLVTLFDSDLRYQIVGGDGFNQVELSPEDLEGNRLQDVFPAENVSVLEPLYRNALNGESSVTELTLGDRVFRIHILPIRDDSRIAGMTVSQDVTAERETERDLRERELHLSQAQEIADLGSWALDFERDELYWSAKCYRIFGIPEGTEMSYERFLERVHPDDRDRIDAQWTAAIDGDAHELEHRILVDGDVKWVHERAEFERDETGRPRTATGVVQDITERKENEQELKRAERRYRTLLEAAPTPIFVADARTGEIVETNAAAATLYGSPREEIVGSHQTDLHPAADEAAYRELFTTPLDDETARTLPDGSQIQLVTADGDRIPVEVRATTVDFDHRRLIYGAFRDISEQLAYERALAGLNDAGQRLFEARTTDSITQEVIQAITTVLDIPLAAVWRFDDGVLRPVDCRSPDGSDSDPALQDAGPDDETLWDAFVTGETDIDNNIAPRESVLNGETPVRSQLVVPIADYGVLAIAETVPEYFGDRTIDLVEILVATAESALERTHREQTLQQREQKLQTRTRELEEAEAITTQIRNVAKAIVDAETRADVVNAVCSHLVNADPIAFAWVGGVDPVEEAVEPRAWAGTGGQYLEHLDGSIDASEPVEPSVRALRTNDPVVVSTIAKDIADVPWRQVSLRYGFQSVLSLPLRYRDTPQGVLSVYATTTAAFDSHLQDVLSELADLAAVALVSIDRKQALLSNEMVELEFEIHDRSCFFLRLPQDVGCSLELEGMVPQPEESTLVFARVHDADPEVLLDRAKQSPEVLNAHIIENEESILVQLELSSQFIGYSLADHGITLRNVTADDESCLVTLTVPPSYDVRHAVEVVSSRYADSKLRAKYDRTDTVHEPQLCQETLNRLTPRQREVLELAYHGGYFDSPKGSSGSDLADVLEISNSTFHGHLRAAERTLLKTVFDRPDRRSM